MALTERDGRVFNILKRRYKRLVALRFPMPRPVAALLFKERVLRKYFFHFLKSKLYNENLLRYRCKKVGKNLMVFGNFMLEGNGDVYIGDNCTIHNNVAIFVGRHIIPGAEIRIGDNCNIAHGVCLDAAKSITIGNNCMIAGGTIILDNDSHPLSVQARRNGDRLDVDTIKPVVIEDDVWIGERCVIMKGVTIGRGSIVSAGSVVVRSIEPMKIAMGVPARVVLWVPPDEQHNGDPIQDQVSNRKPVQETSESRENRERPTIF